MTAAVRVADPDDPRLGDYAALTDAALRKRYEHRVGVLIAEGPNPVRELLDSAYPTRSLLIADERRDEHADLVADALAAGAEVLVVTREVLYEVVRFRLHQGVIACGVRLPPSSVSSVVDGARRLALLEGLNDHENLGTLFRSARGLGVGGVLLGPGCADPLYRRSVRVSMGHVLHVPFAAAPLPDLLDHLADRQVLTVALTPGAHAVELRDLEVAADRAVAVLVGAEGPGLSDVALERADVCARIPMAGGVDSLNVATAAAIAFDRLRPVSRPAGSSPERS